MAVTLSRAVLEVPRVGAAVRGLDLRGTESQSLKGNGSLRPKVVIGKELGRGSFGVVHDGCLMDPETGTQLQRVVAKGPLENKDGLVYWQAELHMNRRVESAGLCKKRFVPFIGTVNAPPPPVHGGHHRRSSRNQSSKSSRSSVEWLIWEYIGSCTVDSLFLENDFTRALGIKLLQSDIGPKTNDSAGSKEREILELAIIRKALAQILKALAGLHAIGIVHRDIKPANLLVANKGRGIRVLDLGAAADLAEQVNYDPSETLIDPLWAAPEKYLYRSNEETDVGQQHGNLAKRMWWLGSPDKFDIFSVGIVFAQMCAPFMRTESGLKRFRDTLERNDLDLKKTLGALPSRDLAQFRILRHHRRQGLKLLELMLRGRQALVAQPFANDRPSAVEALQHPFFSRMRQ